MPHAVHGLKLSSGFRKAPHFDHCYLTYFYSTDSNFSLILILPTTQIITLPTRLIKNWIRYYTIQKKSQIFYANGSPKIFWRQTQKSHIFLQTQQKKFKLTLLEWSSPTVNVKNFWVIILITNWHLNPM